MSAKAGKHKGKVKNTPKRVFYTNAQKQLVRERYQYCVTREEKLELAQALGMETIEQLYNLANRLGATRPQSGTELDDRQDHAQIAFSQERLLVRESIDELKFTKEDDAYIKAHFGRIYIEEIAFHRRHSETAIMYRARKLELRNYCKYWQAEKVFAWLAQEEEFLRGAGIDVYDCKERRGKSAIRLVSTSSLLRLIDDPRFGRLFRTGNADSFFLAELEDLKDELQKGHVEWEPSRWVSHGHTCLNPWAGVSFGLFDDGTDYKMPGRELYPSDIT